MTGALFASSMNLLNAIFLEEWNRYGVFGEDQTIKAKCVDSGLD